MVLRVVMTDLKYHNNVAINSKIDVPIGCFCGDSITTAGFVFVFIFNYDIDGDF